MSSSKFRVFVVSWGHPRKQWPDSGENVSDSVALKSIRPVCGRFDRSSCDIRSRMTCYFHLSKIAVDEHHIAQFNYI